MKTFPPLVFFGSDTFSAAVLAELLQDDLFKSSLRYVVTKTPRISGRGLSSKPTDVEILALTLENVTLLHADTKAQLDTVIDEHKLVELHPLGVLVSYGVIVSQHTLDAFTPGIINLHPSALPRYRGPSPVESAMLAGDETVGVSVMLLSEQMDAGPVYATTTIANHPSLSREELYTKIVQAGAPLLLDTIDSVALDQASPTEQQHDDATYTRLIKKDDGTMRPEEKTAAELEREVRTFLGFPKSRLTLQGYPVIVTKAHEVVGREHEKIVLHCKDDTYLSIDEVVAPSGRTMSADAFLRGYPAK